MTDLTRKTSKEKTITEILADPTALATQNTAGLVTLAQVDGGSSGTGAGELSYISNPSGIASTLGCIAS